MRTIVRTDDDRIRFIDYIKSLQLEKPLTVVIETLKKKRSLRQNKLFHAWMAYLEEATGTSREVWKEYFKQMFLEVYVDFISGKEITTVQHTSELDSKEFSDFMDKVHLQANEEGYWLPRPDDIGYDEFNLEWQHKWRNVR